MRTQESGENYLETILILSKRKGAVRSIDVAAELNFSKPSVSRAMGILKERGYILMDRQGYITLTETGLEYASQVYERHRLLTVFFTLLGVDGATAEQDACRIEHVISEESFSRIRHFVENR